MRLASRDHHISTTGILVPCQSSTLIGALESWLCVLDQHLEATQRVSLLKQGPLITIVLVPREGIQPEGCTLGELDWVTY